MYVSFLHWKLSGFFFSSKAPILDFVISDSISLYTKMFLSVHDKKYILNTFLDAHDMLQVKQHDMQHVGSV